MRISNVTQTTMRAQYPRAEVIEPRSSSSAAARRIFVVASFACAFAGFDALHVEAQSAPRISSFEPAVEAELEPDGWARTATVSYDGTNFLVVYAVGRYVVGARVSEDGTVLDPTGFVIGEANGVVEQLHVAFDGTNHVVLFRNEVRYPGSLRLRRVRPDASLVEPAPIEITHDSEMRADAVAFDGQRFLVAWAFVSPTDGAWDIAAVRVTNEGALLDTNPIAVVDAPGSQSAPSLTYDGSDFVVAFLEHGADIGRNSLFARRVGSDGSLRGATPTLVATDVSVLEPPGLASDGTTTWFSWTDSSSGDVDVYARRLTTSLLPLDATPLPVATGPLRQHAPRMLMDGSAVLTNYVEGQADGSFAARGARIVGSTVTDDSVWIEIDASLGYYASAAPTLGTTVGLVPRFDPFVGALTATRFARDSLAPLGQSVISLRPKAQSAPAAASGTASSVLAWLETSRTETALRIARVGGAETPIAPSSAVLIARGAVAQPQVSFDGSNFLLAFVEESTGDPFVRTLQVDQDGGVVDGSAQSIADTSPWGVRITDLDVAFDGDAYLLVWTRVESFDGEWWSTLMGSRYAPNGQPLDPGGFEIDGGSLGELPSADLAPLAPGFALLVRQLEDDGTHTFRLQRFTDGASATTTTSQALALPASTIHAVLGSDAGELVVAWMEIEGRESRIVAAAIDANGALDPPCGIELHRGTTGTTLLDVSVHGSAARVTYTVRETLTGPSFDLVLASFDRERREAEAPRVLGVFPSDYEARVAFSPDDTALVAGVDTSLAPWHKQRIVLAHATCVAPTFASCDVGTEALANPLPDARQCAFPPPPATGARRGGCSVSSDLPAGSGSASPLLALWAALGCLVLHARRRAGLPDERQNGLRDS